MTTTKLFRSNKTQAVRSPKDVAFPAGVEEVRAFVEGNRRVIVPSDAVWDDLFAAGPVPDFPGREPQPDPQGRDPL